MRRDMNALFRNMIAVISIVHVVALLLVYGWYGRVTDGNPDKVLFLGWCLSIIGVLFVLLNIVKLLGNTNDRYVHLIILVFYLLLIPWMNWNSDHHQSLRRMKFVSQDVQQYEAMVNTLKSTNALTGETKVTMRSVSFPNIVCGKTNSDGSITIWFPGIEGNLRHGYLYHTGNDLHHNPDYPDKPVICITNQWYEYYD